MGKNQSASNLTNIIKQDANGNISFVSGSTTLMSVSSSGAITTTGNVAGTASYASNAELLDGLDSTVFTLTSSFAAQTASFTAFTSSVNTFTASQNILNGTYATTGSNTFAGIQTVNSNLIVTGSITAQTLVVQTVTSSVIYSSGSNVFGNDIANTQTFTGSVNITGSTNLVGALKVNKIGINTGNINLDNNSSNLIVSGAIAFANSSGGTAALVDRDGSGNTTFYGNTGDIRFIDATFTSNYLTIKSAGNVGIGTTSPVARLNVFGTSGNPSMTADTNNLFSITGNLGPQLNVGGYNGASYGMWLQVKNADNSNVNYPILLQPLGGAVGIGTSSPTALLHLGVANAAVDGTKGVKITNPAGTTVLLECGVSSDSFVGTTSASDFSIRTSNSERMRITSDGNQINYGNIFLNQSSVATVNANATSIGINGIYYMNRGSGSGLSHIILGNGGNVIGGVTSNTTNAQFNTSSDYRLKKDLKDFNALDVLSNMKLYDFAWKLNDSRMYGVMAHELKEILPYAVVGEKDELDENGNIKSQGVDYSLLTPVLAKAIQELKAQNDTLKEILQRNNIQ